MIIDPGQVFNLSSLLVGSFSVSSAPGTMPPPGQALGQYWRERWNERMKVIFCPRLTPGYDRDRAGYQTALPFPQSVQALLIETHMETR